MTHPSKFDPRAGGGRKSLFDLLSRYTVSDNGCWEWSGALSKTGGYGIVCLFADGRRQTVHAHRLQWMHTFGRISDGLFVMHICDNRRCINPDHLRLGTAAENMADCTAKGRQARGATHPHAKLNGDAVRVILASSDSGRELAQRFGVSHVTIGRVRRRETWSHPSVPTRCRRHDAPPSPTIAR